MNRVAAISVDLDSIDCYYAIHGLGGSESVPPHARQLVWKRAVPRFLDLFAKHDLKATFFVVGRDLADPQARAMAKELALAGHELGNHSQTHPYDLVAQSYAALDAEVAEAHERLGDVVGRAPRGFRAPGYNISPELMRSLVSRGYRYDSSLFPSPAYYAAKAAIMLGYRAMGKPSRSHLGDVRQLAGPRDPYRPQVAAPWSVDPAQSLVELPVTVAPILGFPIIGTWLILAGPLLRRALLWAADQRPLFNLELHGIELLGAAEDNVPDELVKRQPDLRRSLSEKTATLDAVLGWIAARWPLATLEEVAKVVAQAP